MCDGSHPLHTPSRNPTGISQTAMADAPEEESPSHFLGLKLEEGGWVPEVCFLFFLNLNLMARSSSSAALSATFHNNPSTIFIRLGVNAVPLDDSAVGASLRLADVDFEAHPMSSGAMPKSERSIGSPARS